MTAKKAFFFIIPLIFLIQTSYSQPKATVQLIGGYAIPLPDLAGTFGETRETQGGDFNNYLMKPGLDYGICFLFPINRKKFPLNIAGSLLINSFSQSKEYPLGGSTYIKVDLSQTITSFGLGVGYTFAGRKTKLNPYVDIQFIMSLFSGHYTEDNGTDVRTWTLLHTVRGGLQGTVGIDYVLHNNVGVTLGVRYAYANLIGKSSGQDTQTDYYLNDAEHLDQGVVYRAKKITHMQIFGGASFYFGR